MSNPTCLYHPQEYITNFCSEYNCLLPLCPTCIGQHSEYHQQMKIPAKFYNISDIFSQSILALTQARYMLASSKARNSQLLLNISKYPQLVKEKVADAREEAIKTIYDAFRELQRQLLLKIDRTLQTKKVFQKHLSQNYERTIIEKIDQIDTLKAKLQDQNCLSTLIHFLKDKKFQIEKLNSKVNAYLKSNQEYKIGVQIDPSAQKALFTSIHRMLRLSEQEIPKKTQPNSIPLYPLKRDKLNRSGFKINSPKEIKNSPYKGRPEVFKIEVGRQQRSKSPYEATDLTRSNRQYDKINRRIQEMRLQHEMTSRNMA